MLLEKLYLHQYTVKIITLKILSTNSKKEQKNGNLERFSPPIRQKPKYGVSVKVIGPKDL